MFPNLNQNSTDIQIMVNEQSQIFKADKWRFLILAFLYLSLVRMLGQLFPSYKKYLGNSDVSVTDYEEILTYAGCHFNVEKNLCRCWHHMGKTEGESASHHSPLGHSRSTPTYLKMKRDALQPLGLLTTCEQCRTVANAADVPALLYCYIQVLWGRRRSWQAAETLKSVLGLVFVHVLLGHAQRVLPSFCSKDL